MKGEGKDTLRRQLLGQLLGVKNVRRLGLGISDDSVVLFAVTEGRVVKMDGTEQVGQTGDDHDARGIQVGASSEYAGQNGVDEHKVGKVGDRELALVAVGADAVLVTDWADGVSDDDLRWWGEVS